MPGRGPWIAALAGLLGCSAGSETLFLRFPESESATSAILAVSGDGDLSLSAHTLGEHPKLGPEATHAIDAHAKIELLLYDRPLDQLGLAEGPIVVEASGSELPTPRVSYVAALDAGALGPWVSAPASEMVLGAKVRRDPRSLCTKLVVKAQYETGALMDGAFALTLGPKAAIFGSLDRKLTLVDETGPHPVTDAPADLPAGAAVRLADGEVWFGGELGAVWRGTIDPPPNVAIHAEPVVTSSSGQTIRWILVRKDPELEIHTLGVEGALERYYRGQWSRLHDFGAVQTKGGLVSPEPGVIYAATGAQPQVLRLDANGITEVTPPGLLSGITALDFIPGTGIIFSAGQGRIQVETAVGRWRPIDGGTIGLFIYSFFPLEDGFLMGGALGYVAQYRASSGTFCPAEQLAAGAVRKLLPFGTGYLVAEDVPISRDRAIVTWLEPL